MKSTNTRSLNDELQRARQAIADARHVIVGVGAGFSTAAGLRYDGPAFEHAFADFIARYGITDLYSSSFYPFATPEEHWACWARHIQFIRFAPPAMPLYRQLLQLIADKDYHVITTNVDGQVAKAGFDPQRTFVVQGDYGLLQCAHRCHDTLYPDRELTQQMVASTRQCRIPSSLVPRCPRCGGDMAVHVRVDGYFVEDHDWHDARERYHDALQRAANDTHGSTVLLELGVGFNTPGIIRFPFEQLAATLRATTLIRVNADQPALMAAHPSPDHFIALPTDAATALNALTPHQLATTRV